MIYFILDNYKSSYKDFKDVKLFSIFNIHTVLSYFFVQYNDKRNVYLIIIYFFHEYSKGVIEIEERTFIKLNDFDAPNMPLNAIIFVSERETFYDARTCKDIITQKMDQSCLNKICYVNFKVLKLAKIYIFILI